MTHFGLLCPTASGHLNPMTTLGYELHHRGHEVTLIGGLDAESKVMAAGLNFWPIGEDSFPIGSTASAFAQLGELSGWAALRYVISLFKQSTLVTLQELPDILRSGGIDFLLIDQAYFGGSTVAQYLDLPFISVSCALMLNRDPDIPPINTSWPYYPSWWARWRNQTGNALLSRSAQPITNLIAEYRQKWNLPAFLHPNDAFSNLAQLTQQPAEFEYPRRFLPDCFHFTGPYANPASRENITFPFEKLTGQPLIYASLGTIQNQLLDTFVAIAEACKDLDAQLVISLGGGSSPDALPDLPGSPVIVEFAPQLELLQRATLTITHAGMNTTLESLSHGVPMVAIPIANDQPGVAARIAWTGTGEFLPLKGLTATRLQQTINKVLTVEAYKSNALRLQGVIQRARGVGKSADIIERVAATGKPVQMGCDFHAAP